MNVDARISKAWRRRMLFLLFMLAGSGAWFLLDGYVMWPQEAERYVAYSEIKDEAIDSGVAKDEESSSVRLAWEKYARANDLKTKVPKERTEKAIGLQRIIGWSFVAIATIFAFWVILNHRLKVTAKGETVTDPKGRSADFSAFTRLDRRKWDSKGIMYAFYQEGEDENRMTLDAHKFDGAESIVDEIEKRLKSAQPAGAESVTPPVSSMD